MFTKIMDVLAAAEVMVVKVAVVFWTWRVKSIQDQILHLQTCMSGLEDFAARQWVAKEEALEEVVEMLTRLEEVDRDVRGGGWTPDLARAAAAATAAQAAALSEVAEALAKWARATETEAEFRAEIARETARAEEMVRHLEGWTDRLPLPPRPSPEEAAEALLPAPAEEEGYW